MATEIDTSHLDFLDLEAKYALPESDPYSAYVVVDGAPVTTADKAPKLIAVLTKLFSLVGTVVENGVHMPVEDGKTKGFLFVEFSTPAAATAAIRQLNGKKLDAKHRLFVNHLADVEKFRNVPDEMPPVAVPEYVETPNLREWLQDPAGRDQFVLHKGDMVGVFWNRKKEQPEPAEEPRAHWTNLFVRFSPKGSYLFSMHPQGVQAWGGAGFKLVRRFVQLQVRLIDFSPCEKYLVTLLPEPILIPPEDHPLRALCPFGEELVGHKLVVWELATGSVMRLFRLPEHLEQQQSMPWPLLKWSHDDKYVARVGPDAIAVYDTEKQFELLDKKLVKIEGLVDFEWSPAGAKLADSKTPAHVLAYWTPERPNQTARVLLMEVPLRRVLRSLNLFQVLECRLHWQDEGKLLCVKVDRHTKSKKTVFLNLEFFRVTEKEIPVEKIEVKDAIINFAWEPKSERFVTISHPELGAVNPAVPANTITFYDRNSSGKNKVAKGWTAVSKVANKHLNLLSWSPKGRYVCVGTIARPGAPGDLDFYDVDYEDTTADGETKLGVKQVGHAEYFGLTDVAWDPSGRFVAGWSSFWRHKLENGYKLFDHSGRLLREEMIDLFKDFKWRPRPALLLLSADRKKVRQNLRAYALEFEEQDAMEADTATRELILARHALLDEWRLWRKLVEEELAKAGLVQTVEEVKETVVEEIKEELLEETEEVVGA